MTSLNVAAEAAGRDVTPMTVPWPDPDPHPNGPRGPRHDEAPAPTTCDHDVTTGLTPCVDELSRLVAEAQATADALDIPHLRVLDDAGRELPDSGAGDWTPERVREIAHWADVAPAAHAAAHRSPIAGCPGCPQDADPLPASRDTETSWRQLEAGRRPLGAAA